MGECPFRLVVELTLVPPDAHPACTGPPGDFSEHVGSGHHSSYLVDHWSCVGGPSAVNAICTFAPPIKLGTDPMAVDGIDGRRRGKREEGDEPVDKLLIQPECGE